MAAKANRDLLCEPKPPRPPNSAYNNSLFDESAIKETSIPHASAGRKENKNSSPSKDTTIFKYFSGSQSTSQSPFLKRSAPFVFHATEQSSRQSASYKHTDESRTRILLGEYHFLRYRDEKDLEHNISVSKLITERLKECYEEEDFEAFLRSYLIRKHKELRGMLFPFTGPERVYCLCRVVCRVTHEMFADAIKVSGILQDFCSADVEDEAFGSAGKWEDVETSTPGGAGIPPFTDDFVNSVITSCEELVRGEKPFCRLHLLPYQESGILAKKERNYPFYGHIVVVMKPDTLSFRHQRDFLEASSEHLFRDWRPNIRTALVIWANESYLNRYSVPLDVDECFAAWALETVGESAIVDYGALLRAFLESFRNAKEKAKQLIF